ncbi:prepilin-type N-terminal cleavage/methylation domain-containing protein [Desulfosediminicola sp.]|uniref:prepilin-type N-terminal cleavage/methylation domain-containing protein n=1 Tax=Desulfosediminicola sp. TaxID=2886825 RepID=UPI003AF2FE58
MSTLKSINRYQSTAQDGFTLVELLIAMVVSSFVIAAIYSAYQVQQRQYTNQTQVVEMQQNLRAAMLFMASEIRMAGYDPQGTAGAGFIEARTNRVQFTKDTVNNSGTTMRGDGALTGTMENVYFGFIPADDTDSNGIIADGGAAKLVLSQDNGTNYEAIADNISAIEFSYTMVDGTISTAPTDLSKIASVTVSILARAKNPDLKFTNNISYTTGSGNSWGPYNDNFRRRLLISNITCRNMGL